MKKFPKLFEKSLLARLGVAMGTITLLSVLGMASAIIIAGITQGSAATINKTGTLRMQSYRIASQILLSGQHSTREDWQEITDNIVRFEKILNDENLLGLSISQSNEAISKQYQAVHSDWNHLIKPGIMKQVRQGKLKQLTLSENIELVRNISAFVIKIDNLVHLLTLLAENRITLLSSILGISLFLIVIVVSATMYFVYTDVLIPLRDLLTCTESLGKGNLSIRTMHTTDDELGRLGIAFNAMAEDLSRLYASLEDRVREKTADLERSNRSLELLYHSIARLYDAPVAKQTYQKLLKDIEHALDLGRGSACLIDHTHTRAELLASTLQPAHGDANLCKEKNCKQCMQGETITTRHIGRHGEKNILSIPLHDLENRYGVLQIEVPQGKEVESWQIQLLEALSRHIGIAIGTAQRTEQSRRLSLLEERSVIARELHDSLAQSLSYMKIQVSRLQTVLSKHSLSDEASSIMTELREGLNGAYRELRELLTTFRLKMEGTGLIPTLEKTVQEFSARGNIPIHIQTLLSDCTLSANEEIHVMQIVREALANVIHHSKATYANVSIEHNGHQYISVIIEDNGIGIGTSQSATHHYGMSIMQERARSLGGTFHVQDRAVGGTRITFRFQAGLRTSNTTHTEGLSIS